jgi:hypothetical protein
MTELLAALLSISLAAGLNAYATVLALGVMHRLEWIQLPVGLDVLGSTVVLLGASILYVVEFIADKVPYFDNVWDGIHTFIRPAAGALLAYGVVGNVDPQWQVIAALAGGGIAFTSHAAKASTRAAVNLSPEPFSNWALSLGEDVLSFGLVWLMGSHPMIALFVAVLLVAIAIFVIWKLSKLGQRVFTRMFSPGKP